MAGVSLAGNACGPKGPFADGIDDGLYVSRMLSEIQASYCVDPRRTWATGFAQASFGCGASAGSGAVSAAATLAAGAACRVMED